MAYLADTNLLVRLANLKDSKYTVANQAVDELHRLNELVCITLQNLIEFRAVATRPIAANGLGLSATEAETQANEFEAVFPLLEEVPAIFPLWKALVASEGIVGKQVHDARLVAVCHAHGVTHLLTFNGTHFMRLSRFGPGVEIVDPTDI